MSEATVIALGFFDGVHLGHGALLRKTAERAAQLGVTPAAFTFDRSPREFVTGTRVPLLTDAQERAALIRELYGVERVFVAVFDRTMMTMPWRAFVTDLLVARYHAVHLVAGYDFRFGSGNEGDCGRLRLLCRELGLGCDVIAPVEHDGVTVSSTLIRRLIEAGEVRRAAEFLGHPHRMRGSVCHGQGVGKKLLFPTANLLPAPHIITPARGVYATRAFLDDGTSYAGVTNVGVHPTVGAGDTVTVETFLTDFSGDLYGRELRLDFYDFLRPEQRFPSVAALYDQISHDAARARALVERTDG